MYLIHYAFVSWLQYTLLRAALPAVAKGSIVFLGTVLLSWGTTGRPAPDPGSCADDLA
jgi:hypothetical protein